MIKNTLALFLLLFGSLLLAGCGESIDVVDAGTYTGTVDEAVPAEEEIYVSLDSGERLELYFSDTTELVANGQTADFSQLAAGTPVRVTVEREDNRNVPTRVEIMP
ncbi:MAG: hypothetical protein ACLFU2_07875 [Opitutales bacterium]